jgi:hypothetical protein
MTISSFNIKFQAHPSGSLVMEVALSPLHFLGNQINRLNRNQVHRLLLLQQHHPPLLPEHHPQRNRRLCRDSHAKFHEIYMTFLYTYTCIPEERVNKCRIIKGLICYLHHKIIHPLTQYLTPICEQFCQYSLTNNVCIYIYIIVKLTN